MSHLEYFDYEGYGKRARKEIHYAQAVRIDNRIECSGQGGWDRPMGEITKDLGKEIDQAFANVEHTLKVAGGKGWEEVYKIRSYHVPLSKEALGHTIRNIQHYCPNHEPLFTCVGVPELAFPEMHIEVEVEAQIK